MNKAYSRGYSSDIRRQTTMEKKTSGIVEAEKLKQNTREMRRRIGGLEAKDEDTDESFSKLVGYMLW